MTSENLTESAPLDRLKAADLPVVVDRYTLTGFLGEGGMARVFRAEMQGAMGFRKAAAFKVLLPDGSDASEFRSLALAQEARVGGLLTHPNIAQVFDCGVHGGLPYIAMELVEGPSLRQLVDELGPLPTNAVLDAAAQTCRGLHHAHTAEHEGRELRIVHRDVKPSNILVRRDGVVKLVDFGIARSQLEGGLKTEPGVARGTPSFMSPEQLAAGDLDGRSDLFALGSVLYFALTGRMLFTGASLAEVFMRITQVEDTLDSLGTFAVIERLAPGLGAVLRRLFTRDPQERYASAAELADALEELRQTAPASATLSELAAALRALQLEPSPGPSPAPGSAPPAGRRAGGAAIAVDPTRRQGAWRQTVAGPPRPEPASPAAPVAQVPPTRDRVRPRRKAQDLVPTRPQVQAKPGPRQEVPPTRPQVRPRSGAEGMTPTRPQLSWREDESADGTPDGTTPPRTPHAPLARGSNLGLVEGAEHLLSSLVGRIFDPAIVRSERAGDRVDPGAIPRAVIRELQRHVQPIGNERYSPHIVRLVATPAVHEVLGVLRLAVLQEVERAAEEWAHDEGVRFLQPFRAEWTQAELGRIHQVDVQVSYDLDPAPRAEPETEASAEDPPAAESQPPPEEEPAVTELAVPAPWGRLVPKNGPSLVLAGTLVVGRRPPADLIIDDPSVSSRHARLYQDERGRCLLEDLESLNGTRVGARPAGAVARLRHGDRVEFGTQAFRFEEVEGAAGG